MTGPKVFESFLPNGLHRNPAMNRYGGRVEEHYGGREFQRVDGGREFQRVDGGREFQRVDGGREFQRVDGGREFQRVDGGREFQRVEEHYGGREFQRVEEHNGGREFQRVEEHYGGREFQRVEEHDEGSSEFEGREQQRVEEAAGASDSSCSSNNVDYLKISISTVHRVDKLLRNQKQILNEFQCLDLLEKLSRAVHNIKRLVRFSEIEKKAFCFALRNFFRVTENAKRLVEGCCSENWCQAAALQINNEEAFREILVDAGLCYDEIWKELIGGTSSSLEDLRQSPAFSPAMSTEVRKDQEELYKRLMGLVVAKPLQWTTELVQRRRLGLHLLERLHAMLQNEGGSPRSDLRIARDNSHLDSWGEYSNPLRDGVFIATWLGMTCAKKVYRPGEWNLNHFQTEVNLLQTLNHPNLVKFFHCEKDDEDGECFLAMELMQENLQDVIQKNLDQGSQAPFSLPVAVDIMIQIANGMCYLHDHEVAHRHLEPANVLVYYHESAYDLPETYFHVKLADFGLLKAERRASGAGSSKPAIRRTVYGAPEAFSRDGRGSEIATRSDVYSFGVLASHILTGKKPFEGIPPSQLNEAILRNARPHLPPSCPEELASIIRDCWVKEHRKRPLFVDICCRLVSVRRSLNPAASQHDLDPPVSSYAHGVCSERSAVRQLTAKARIDKNWSRVLGVHSSRSLPTMAADGAGSSSSAGSSFVNCDSQSHVRNNSEQIAAQVDVVIELVRDLSSRRAEVRRDAANQLRCLAKLNSENRLSIAEHGGIPVLTNLLRSSDKMTQEHAITALMNLSLQESNRALIMRAGAIEGIVHAVKWGQSMEARENAAATIQCLSYENENKISIGNTGAIPALVDLLRNGTTLQGKKDAANALCNLVSHQEGNKRRAIRTGIITVLMDILQDHSTHDLDDISLAILANLSVLVDGLVEIGNTEPVTVLVNFITCGSTRGQELATALLWTLCTDDPAFIQAAYDCGATSPLKAVLRNETATPRCKRKAKQLLDLLR